MVPVCMLVQPRHLFGTCQIVWFSLNVKLDIHGWQIDRQNECEIAKIYNFHPFKVTQALSNRSMEIALSQGIWKLQLGGKTCYKFSSLRGFGAG